MLDFRSQRPPALGHNASCSTAQKRLYPSTVRDRRYVPRSTDHPYVTACMADDTAHVDHRQDRSAPDETRRGRGAYHRRQALRLVRVTQSARAATWSTVRRTASHAAC